MVCPSQPQSGPFGDCFGTMFETDGQPSTWFPPVGRVEQSSYQTHIAMGCDRKGYFTDLSTIADSTAVASEDCVRFSSFREKLTPCGKSEIWNQREPSFFIDFRSPYSSKMCKYQPWCSIRPMFSTPVQGFPNVEKC